MKQCSCLNVLRSFMALAFSFLTVDRVTELKRYRKNQLTKSKAHIIASATSITPNPSKV
jgi:hypothetical protein